jgi:hypothetical protein
MTERITCGICTMGFIVAPRQHQRKRAEQVKCPECHRTFWHGQSGDHPGKPGAIKCGIDPLHLREWRPHGR